MPHDGAVLPPFGFPHYPPINLVKVEAQVYRIPIAEPVQTSFGEMRDRPAVFIRLEDDQGAHGWGEIWCNFPNVGAEHRARMVAACIAPLLKAQPWQHPTQAFQAVSQQLEVLGIQTGEPGTIAQCIAGLDIALWDLVARRQGRPLWQIFGGTPDVQVYASGINPQNPVEVARRKQAEGYRAFKLKIGFDAQHDLANFSAMREALGPSAVLMVDANQAWSLDTALRLCPQFAPFDPQWIEEPIRADSPPDAWRHLAQATRIPLAAGENLRGARAFKAAVDEGTLRVIQPDIGKWGGFSGCLPVAAYAVREGRVFCPHWLGGGIGLLASMHLKASIGHAGYVEVDANPNPLRDVTGPNLLQPKAGVVTLPDAAGLGVEPDFSAVKEFKKLTCAAA
jgi:L-alanine-DL-glutamate epimerase-like enolase superfamily enzyme